MSLPWPTSTARALATIQNQLTQLTAKVDHMSDQQAELNADVQALAAALADVATQNTTLGTDLTAITAEITSLEQQVASGGTVDLTGLTALVTTAQSTQAGLDTTVGTATGLVPPPAPTTPPVTP